MIWRICQKVAHEFEFRTARKDGSDLNDFWSNRSAPVPAKICKFLASLNPIREGENVGKLHETTEKVVLAIVCLTKNKIEMAMCLTAGCEASWQSISLAVAWSHH